MHACNTSTTKKNLAMSYYDNDYSDDMYDRYMHTGEGAEYFEEESPCEYIPPRRRYYKVSSGKHCNDELDEIIRRLKQQKKEERRAKEAQEKTTQQRNIRQRPDRKKSSSSGCLVFMLVILFACIMLAL